MKKFFLLFLLFVSFFSCATRQSANVVFKNCDQNLSYSVFDLIDGKDCNEGRNNVEMSDWIVYTDVETKNYCDIK